MIRSLVRYSTAALLTASLLCASNVYAQRKAGGGDSGSGGSTRSNSTRILEVFKPVVGKAATATVSVRLDGKQVALGAIVDADGYILTKDRKSVV